MAERSSIEWTDSTFNPWIGCTKISPACDHCYAERSTPARAGGIAWGAGAPRHRTSAANWKLPLRWNARRFMACEECGWRGECDAELIGCGNCGSSAAMNDARRRVFCASLADVFDNEVPIEWRRELFELIASTPNLDWLLLTKRIGNVSRMVTEIADRPRLASRPGDFLAYHWRNGNAPANVWLGATVANQGEADRDIPKLLEVPAAVRWLSCEPLLGSVDLAEICDGAAHREIPREYWTDVDNDDSPPAIGIDALTGLRWQRFGDWYEYGSHLDWVVVGGESGPAARAMHPEWARSLRDQCAAAGVPFFFKQWGEWAPALSGMWFHPMQDMPHFSARAAGRDTHDFGAGLGAVRIGRRPAGRLLDGREHSDWPRAANLKEI
ncbi:phage Gp37/Gp68 family protein [Dyella sp. 2RAB6]|uniref:phage Gp37/Gp68 family protein n=1 Tax=Dyella sp. 2RAB6 TaxID=3232992 RepID=UPI003F8F951E